VTNEEKRAKHREYMRQWRQRESSKCKEREYRVNTRRRRALEELLAERTATTSPAREGIMG
jgi:hypothetical protein